MINVLTSLTCAMLLTVGVANANSSSDQLARIALPEGGVYPNGITHANDGTLYVGQITQGGVLRRSPVANGRSYMRERRTFLPVRRFG
ncbi:hypothetical protein HED63_21220 [Ochrobactrum cytisi]|nr:hypothetical protein [Brucella cytisi]